mmetsp:Transcript_41555/g.98494  ORF Transcript_41555/g.98494 Transcript_41555/m.98494 type:complete len:207 (-) Transcript_41555:1248-1868(-)
MFYRSGGWVSLPGFSGFCSPELSHRGLPGANPGDPCAHSAFALDLTQAEVLKPYLLLAQTCLPHVAVPRRAADVDALREAARLHAARHVDRVPEQAEPRPLGADHAGVRQPSVHAKADLEGPPVWPPKPPGSRDHVPRHVEGPLGMVRASVLIKARNHHVRITNRLHLVDAVEICQVVKAREKVVEHLNHNSCGDRRRKVCEPNYV